MARERVIPNADDTYSFLLNAGVSLVAGFALKTYEITVTANPIAGGEVMGGGTYTHFDQVTVTALPDIEYYIFEYWTEGGEIVSTDPVYTFMADKERDLVANFRLFFYVNVDVNIPEYGHATGTGEYVQHEIASVEAFANHCYRFANWTIDGMEVSSDNPYSFPVTKRINIVANFHALDFDSYSPLLWDNTFMLNLKKLKEDGYEVTGCKWFKNGVEETSTNTVDEYSYSAGCNAPDKLDTEPAQYMFQLITSNFGALCSSVKTIKQIKISDENTGTSLLAYPNPLPSGSQITIEGAVKGSMIRVYNQAGACVKSEIATTDCAVRLTLPFAEGVYVIRNGNKMIKVVVTNN